MQDERSSHGENRSCTGLLYYSKALGLKGKPPVCYGVSKHTRTDTPTGAGEQGMISYSCAGYSVYRKASGLSGDTNAQGRKPYCVGVEMISAEVAAGGQQEDLILQKMRAEAEDRKRKLAWASAAQRSGVSGSMPAWAERQPASVDEKSNAPDNSFQGRFISMAGKIMVRSVKHAGDVAELVTSSVNFFD